MIIRPRILSILILLFASIPAAAMTVQPGPSHTAIRVMTMNAQDIGSADLESPSNPRLRRLAAIIQQIRPNILLLSEIARDDQALNAARFVRQYLSMPQAQGLDPIDFNTYMPPSNTGIPSGHDLDNNGIVAADAPPSSPSDDDGRPARQSAEGRAFGNDCFGFGTYPGQYAFALLVDPKLKINIAEIRTFQHFLWKDLPGAEQPINSDGSPWYSPQEWDVLRLSSKTLADVPVILPDGQAVHFLISHPTPPAFDGPEQRNKRRNRDEIRLLGDYIANSPTLIDDAGNKGGIDPTQHFVILGDLNADPVDGSSLGSPISEFLLSSPQLAPDPTPSSGIAIDRFDATDTARFRLRVDYVLPSKQIRVLQSEIWRAGHDAPEGFPSDHFPVWAELAIPRLNK